MGKYVYDPEVGKDFFKNTLTIKKTTDKLNSSKHIIKRVKRQIMGWGRYL